MDLYGKGLHEYKCTNSNSMVVEGRLFLKIEWWY